jgi:hypothetical protein
MTNKISGRLFCLCIAFIPYFSFAQNPAGQPEENREWIIRSNSFTKLLIDIDEKYSPEFGSDQGLAYFDTLVSVPTTANKAAERSEKETVVATFKSARPKETNLAVKQDLDILVNQTNSISVKRIEISRKVPFLNPTARCSAELNLAG